MSSTTLSPFELTIVPQGERDYRLALWQRPVTSNGEAALRPLVTLRGTPLQVAMDQVLDFLKRDGHRSSVLTPSHREPVPLSEESGVRLGLLFMALRPLLRVERMEAIASGLRAMPSEEAYYWFSKCGAPRDGLHAQRALRILLAGE